MSTLGEIKARIADELNRDDLTNQIADRINRAIYFYGAKRFWFNEQRITSLTVAGSQYLDLPPGCRLLDTLYITVGGTGYELDNRPTSLIEEWQALSPSQGQPTDYARVGDQVRFYVTPSQAYPLAFTGVFDLDALASDDDSNSWTTEAEDLIVGRVTAIIQRDIIRDNDSYTRATLAEKEALSALVGETTRKLSTGVQPWQ